MMPVVVVSATVAVAMRELGAVLLMVLQVRIRMLLVGASITFAVAGVAFRIAGVAFRVAGVAFAVAGVAFAAALAACSTHGSAGDHQNGHRGSDPKKLFHWKPLADNSVSVARGRIH
jgi:hypothetical protein